MAQNGGPTDQRIMTTGEMSENWLVDENEVGSTVAEVQKSVSPGKKGNNIWGLGQKIRRWVKDGRYI